MRWGARWTWVVLVAGCEGESGASLPAAWQQRADELVEQACMQADSCACELSTASSPCTSVLAARWRARLVAGHERGLQWDDDCAAAIGEAIDAAGCAWPRADTSNPCHTFCQVLHGDRGLGETCHGLDEIVSDCEQGLSCSHGRCVEPCTVLTGLAQGEACRDSSGIELDRCADGLACGYGGRCEATLALGAPCSQGQCGIDAYCSWIDANPVCRPASTAGQSCDYADCARGFSCSWPDAICIADAGVGESCDGRECMGGLYCDGVQCRAPAELGASCSNVPCVDGLVCEYPNSICADPPAIGAPCDEGSCALDAWCDFSSTTTSPSCRALIADDEACSGHSQCASRYCPAGACRPRPRLGEDCSGALVCAAGLSCDGAICRESATQGPAICVYDGW